MRPSTRVRVLLWAATLCVLAALAAGVASAPLAVFVSVAAVAVAAQLVWRFGAVEGLWYLLIFLMPLREPLSVDVLGTVTLYLGDVLLFSLFAVATVRGALRTAWRSSIFRIGTAVLALSVAGLFGATRLLWGVASLYRLSAQLALFVLAIDLVRSAPVARRTLMALVVGVVPAAAYGLYQAALPYGVPLPDWASALIAYEADGTKNLRVFSFFDHTLGFSHYLSVVIGVATGLFFADMSRRAKALSLFVAGLAAYCNLFTYSLGGVLGGISGAVGSLASAGRRWAALIVPVLLVAVIVVSPGALLNKVERVVTGQATTAAARLVTYQQAFNILQDRPLTGVGWGGIRTALEHEYRLTRAQAVAYTAENYFLLRGMALGWPGILLYAAIAVIHFRNLIRARVSGLAQNWPIVALMGGSVAFYFQAQSYSATKITSNLALWLFLGIAASLALSSRARAGDDEGPRSVRSRR